MNTCVGWVLAPHQRRQCSGGACDAVGAGGLPLTARALATTATAATAATAAATAVAAASRTSTNHRSILSITDAAMEVAVMEAAAAAAAAEEGAGGGAGGGVSGGTGGAGSASSSVHTMCSQWGATLGCWRWCQTLRRCSVSHANAKKSCSTF